MDAKPTLYRGVTYRSRTEARWAVFFDSLALKHEYEPCYFAEAWGTYTPDFYIHRDDELDIGPLWVEVKGFPPTSIERRRLRTVCQRVHCEGLLLIGQPNEEGAMFLFSPFEDWQGRDVSQRLLEFLLGANTANFVRARNAHIEDAATPPESPLLSVTRSYDESLYTPAAHMTPAEIAVVAEYVEPSDETLLLVEWRTQRRALIALLSENGQLHKQVEAIKTENAQLFQMNSWLRFILYVFTVLVFIICVFVCITEFVY